MCHRFENNNGKKRNLQERERKRKNLSEVKMTKTDCIQELLWWGKGDLRVGPGSTVNTARTKGDVQPSSRCRPVDGKLPGGSLRGEGEYWLIWVDRTLAEGMPGWWDTKGGEWGIWSEVEGDQISMVGNFLWTDLARHLLQLCDTDQTKRSRATGLGSICLVRSPRASCQKLCEKLTFIEHLLCINMYSFPGWAGSLWGKWALTSCTEAEMEKSNNYPHFHGQYVAEPDSPGRSSLS